jgi:hypothetical protein
MIDMFYDEMFWWLLGTAIIFTFVGRWMSFRDIVGQVTEATIDSLIRDGYLKTQGTGRNMEILKHTEWCKKDVDT